MKNEFQKYCYFILTKLINLAYIFHNFRVKGVKGLRVADASVMPQITSGNTHIPVIMIAEKASDIIKGSIHCPSAKQDPELYFLEKKIRI